MKKNLKHSIILAKNRLMINRLILVLIFASAIFSCKKKDEVTDANTVQTNEKSKGVNVTVTTVSGTTFNQQLVANGLVSAVQKSNLRFKTSEELVDIKVRNGQKVVKDQVLGVLENSILKNRLEKSEIDFNKAKNEFVNQKLNYGFQRNTPDTDIKPSVLQNIKIKSGFFEAKNAYENAKILYNQTILRAPFSGIVANLDTKEGNFISTSDMFCTVIKPDNLEVTFSILENEYALLSLNQEIEISSFANTGTKYKGKITEINPLVDKNGLIKIRANVIAKQVSLLDGMNVKVFVNKPLPNVIVVPKQALVLRSNREVVFTVTKGLAKWNYVELAGENSDSYAIKKGLQVKDTIIVSGNLNLSHDAVINTTFQRNSLIE